MRSRILRLLMVLFIVGIFVGLAVQPALAIANPTSTSIISYRIFRNVWTSGDQLWFVEYNVAYGSTPTDPASNNFEMVIEDSTGTTLYYSRPLNYYQTNIISIYLTSSQALNWGGAYTIKITGFPTVFPVLIEDINMDTKLVGAGDYYEASTLTSYMVAVATDMQTALGVALLTSANILNTAGATYFLTAVPNLGSMAPSIFSMVGAYPSVTRGQYSNVTLNQTLAANEGARLTNAMTSLGAPWQMGRVWVEAFAVMVITFMLASIIYAFSHSSSAAFIFSFPLAIGLAWFGLGGTNMLFLLFILVLMVVLLFGAIWILGRMF